MVSMTTEPVVTPKKRGRPSKVDIAARQAAAAAMVVTAPVIITVPESVAPETRQNVNDLMARLGYVQSCFPTLQVGGFRPEMKYEPDYAGKAVVCRMEAGQRVISWRMSAGLVFTNEHNLCNEWIRCMEKAVEAEELRHQQEAANAVSVRTEKDGGSGGTGDDRGGDGAQAEAKRDDPAPQKPRRRGRPPKNRPGDEPKPAAGA